MGPAHGTHRDVNRGRNSTCKRWKPTLIPSGNVDTLQRRPIYHIGFAPVSEEGSTYIHYITHIAYIYVQYISSICHIYFGIVLFRKGSKRCKTNNILPYHSNSAILLGWNDYMEWRHVSKGWFRWSLCFGIKNTAVTPVQNFAIRISSVKTVRKCLRKLKVLWTNLIYMFHLYWYLHSMW